MRFTIQHDFTVVNTSINHFVNCSQFGLTTKIRNKPEGYFFKKEELSKLNSHKLFFQIFLCVFYLKK